MLVTPEILRADKKIRGMLWSFDFEVQDPSHETIWFDAAPLQPFEILAVKCSGCVESGLGKAGEAALRLHHAVTVLGADVILRSPDGYPSEPLVGPFKLR